jgi:hypothetical protein
MLAGVAEKLVARLADIGISGAGRLAPTRRYVASLTESAL